MNLIRVVPVLIFGFVATLMSPANTGAEPVPVFVSILPQKYFLEKIGGDLVQVSVMVAPGASPEFYEPKSSQMVGLSKARAYFAIGVPFEEVWLKRIAAANSAMLVVHTDAGIEKRPMKAHRHPPEGGHGASEREEKGIHWAKDPHIWLSPPLAMLQARNILQGLIEVDPGNRSFFETRYKAFIMEIVNLDAELMGIFAEEGKQIGFMVFHPAWGYFAQAYGLEQVPIEVEGKEPKPFELGKLIQYAKERSIKVVFVAPQFSTKSAQVIAKAIGAQIGFADPLSPDWAANLRDVAERFKASLK